MLQSSLNASSKKNYISTAVAAFVGILAAIPISLALFGPGNQADAVQNQSPVSTAEVSGPGVDYAQFAYAYSQGYLAKASTGTSADNDGAVCSEATASTASVDLPVGGSGNAVEPEEIADGAAKAYNSYNSYIYNNAVSEVNNTNSNNTVGSNNATTTTVKVNDSKGVAVTTNNTTTGTNLAIDDSLNTDSYNTKTDTSIINDSFNKETTVIKDSGNASASTTTTDNSSSNSETTNVEIKDSGNTSTDNSIQDNTLKLDVDLKATQPVILPNNQI